MTFSDSQSIQRSMQWNIPVQLNSLIINCDLYEPTGFDSVRWNCLDTANHSEAP